MRSWGVIDGCLTRGVGLVGICFMGCVCSSGLRVVGGVVVHFVGMRSIMGRTIRGVRAMGKLVWRGGVVRSYSLPFVDTGYVFVGR